MTVLSKASADSALTTVDICFWFSPDCSAVRVQMIVLRTYPWLLFCGFSRHFRERGLGCSSWTSAPKCAGKRRAEPPVLPRADISHGLRSDQGSCFLALLGLGWALAAMSQRFAFIWGIERRSLVTTGVMLSDHILPFSLICCARGKMPVYQHVDIWYQNPFVTQVVATWAG